MKLTLVYSKLAIAGLLLATVAGFSSRHDDTADDSAVGRVTADDSAVRRVLRCRVRLREAAPMLPTIAVDKTTEHCGAEIVDPVLRVVDGYVADVVGHLVVDESVARPTPPKESAIWPLELRGCLMQPRVQCARLGDRLRLENRDRTTHNPHGWRPNGLTGFNVTLYSDGARIERRLRDAGIHRVDCDTHSWMRAWVHVFDDPWYGRSAEDGWLEIVDPPVGQQTLHLWHEVLGERRFQVHVPKEGALEIVVDFDLVDHRPAALRPAGMGSWIRRAPAADAPTASGR